MIIRTTVELSDPDESLLYTPDAAAAQIIAALGGNPTKDTCYVTITQAAVGQAGVTPPPTTFAAPEPHVTDVPHFSLPFRFANPQAAVNEQDSVEEVADACLAVLLCPVGFRVELPSFGLEDPTFSTPAPDLDTIRASLDQWEPRATATLSEYPDLFDALVSHVEVDVQLRTEA